MYARNRLYGMLVGLVSLGILLQPVWAGMFIRSGEANDATWVDVHARGAEVIIAVAALSLIVAIWRLRSRR
jgi:hypothetical protein